MKTVISGRIEYLQIFIDVYTDEPKLPAQSLPLAGGLGLVLFLFIKIKSYTNKPSDLPLTTI